MGKKSKAAASSPAKVPLPSSPAATTPSLKKKSSASKSKAAVSKIVPALAAVELSKDSDDDSASESDEDDDETGGVDEQGMKRLMDLLGDDGLDEFGAAQLDALNGADSEAESSGSGGDSDSESDSDLGLHDGETVGVSSVDEDAVSDDEDEGWEDEEDEDEEIALDEDDVSVDEDTVPKQKVVIDNKVGLSMVYETQNHQSSFSQLIPDPHISKLYDRLHSKEFEKPSSLIHHSGGSKRYQ